MSIGQIVLLVSTVLVLVGRCTIPGHGLSWPGTYEALSHIWVGLLIGLWWKSRDRWLLIALAVTTVFETIMFLLRTK